jgi:hypothetical protein
MRGISNKVENVFKSDPNKGRFEAQSNANNRNLTGKVITDDIFNVHLARLYPFSSGEKPQ